MKSCAIGIVFDPTRQKVLIIQRRDVAVWVLPGGGIDRDETPEEAVVREVKEETGITVSIVRKVAEYTPVNKLAQLTHLFECKPLGGELTTGDETHLIEFRSINTLPKEFFIVHLEWLVDALKNETGLIRKPLTSVNYLNLIKYFINHPLHVLRFALTRCGFPLNRTH
jgi:8-oxo-dGTP diphosphatase